MLLIRHGEKPVGHESGFDDRGATSKHGLSPTGWQRCGALAGMVPSTGAGGEHPSFPTPTALVCPEYGTRRQHRSYLTLVGVARKLGLEPQHSLPVDADPHDVVRSLLSASSEVVLVCWEHDHLPGLARAVEVLNPADIPSVWPADRFDVLWRFERQDAGAYRFTQVPLQLLAGDLPTAIVDR